MFPLARLEKAQVASEGEDSNALSIQHDFAQELQRLLSETSGLGAGEFSVRARRGGGERQQRGRMKSVSRLIGDRAVFMRFMAQSV